MIVKAHAKENALANLPINSAQKLAGVQKANANNVEVLIL